MSSVENFYQDLHELVAQVEVLKSEFISLEATGISAIRFDKIGTSHNISKPTEQDALKLIEKQTELQQRIILMTQRVEILQNALKALTPFELEVFTRKVINNEPYYRICGDLKMTERHAKRVKAKALIKLECTIYTKNKFNF